MFNTFTFIFGKSLSKGVILRLPALFVLDWWFRTDPKQLVQVPSDIRNTVFYYAAFVLAVIIEILPLEKLVTCYKSAVSCFLLYVSYFLSLMFVGMEKTEYYYVSYNINHLNTDRELLYRVLLHLISQCFIAAIIAYLAEMPSWFKYLLLVFTMPVFARLIGYYPDKLLDVHNFASVFTLLMIVIFLFNILSNTLRICINRAYFAFKTYDPLRVLVNFWGSIFLSGQMLIFGVSVVLRPLFTKMEHNEFIKYEDTIRGDRWLVIMLTSIREFCFSPIRLCAFYVMVYYISYDVLKLTKFYLQDNEMTPLVESDREGTRGISCFFTVLITIRFYMLDSSTFQRAFLLSTVLFIAVSLLMQSMYVIVDPILLKLGVSPNKSWIKHDRVFALCIFLAIFPQLFLFYCHCLYKMIFDLHNFIFDLVNIYLFMIPVKVIGSLVVYALFIYDSLRTRPWGESLSDIIFWARACTEVLQHLVAVYVASYSFKDSTFDAWILFVSLVLSILLISVAVKGWVSFVSRWKAVTKVDSLLLATGEQLENYNDDCSICYQEMESARITHCKHYFHSDCLRKWLYITETCPKCHQEIFKSGDSNNETENNADNSDRHNRSDNFNRYDFSTDQSDSDSE